MSRLTRERNWWSKGEDEVLRKGAQTQLDEIGTVKNWNDIAALLPGRTNKDCRKRWYKVCQGIRKGAWTSEEDQRLNLAVEQVGFKWAQVSKLVQTRNADQCSKRWQHVLGPDLKHTPWTSEEDAILREAITKYGNDWKQIGLSDLPNRSSHDIRNRSVALNRRDKHLALLAQSNRQSSSGELSESDSREDEEYEDEYTEEGTQTYGWESNLLVDSEIYPELQLSVSGSELTSPFGYINEDEVQGGQDTNPYLDAMIENAPLSVWDIACSSTHIQQQPPNISSWLQLGTPAASNWSQDEGSQVAMESKNGACFDFNLADADLFSGEISDRRGENRDLTGAESSQDTASSRSGAPGASEAISTSGKGRGSVTLVLKQVNPTTSQEIIGSLLKHNTDLTVRVFNDQEQE
ncbi:hypothetical protein GGR54DRAFT_598392 [Hypoxylon sp. NC1633]|nr:hypothetical protein GGR54DRAFT_598392 [Hypoxylon sp. NC1633]